MIEMTLREVASAMNARSIGSASDRTARRVVIDSREVEPGDLFVAIRGERFDGHVFVNQAVECGAAACVIDRRSLVGSANGRASADGTGDGAVRLVVSDTIEALGALATYYRKMVIPASTVVVAITGSNGKTTTKSMLHHVLSASLRGHASLRSFNNQIGVPLTLLSADAEDRFLIAEIGTNAPGEVAMLAKMVSPDVAVITSIGEAHLEGLGSLAAIAREKASLLNYVRPGGLAVVNVDRPEMAVLMGVVNDVTVTTVGCDCEADVVARAVESSLASTVVEVDGRHRLEVAMPGLYHAGNVAIVWTVTRRFGLSTEVVADRLQTFLPQVGRARTIELDGVTLVDDTYNANPASMTGAIDALARERSRRRVMVMGDMRELGERSADLHEAMVHRACDAGIEVLVAVGCLSTKAVAARGDRRGDCRYGGVMFCFDDATLAAAALPSILRRGDCVWVKGSRAMGLERIIDSLRRQCAAHVAVA